MGKILYIRNFASRVNPKMYNLQEIGLCKSLVKKGYNCDIVYYNQGNSLRVESIYTKGSNQLRIFWMPAHKFMSNSIFPKVFEKSFLNQYDLVITTEYNQIMTYLLSWRKDIRLALYHGPYQDNNKIIIQKVYDFICLPKIRKSLGIIFTKSILSETYLRKKGFRHIHTIGVGLDVENIISNDIQMTTEVQDLAHKLKGKKALLYIGVLEDRRNIMFLLEVFNRLCVKRKDIVLVIVGDGSKQDKDRYWEYARELGLLDKIIYFENIQQKEISQIYALCDVFIFPTRYDIFGMVLLECMYLGLPIVSSVNGGSRTLIENQVTGIIVDEFEPNYWSDAIELLLNNDELRESIVHQAFLRVQDNYTWDSVGEQLLQKIKLPKMER
ncbi:Glycosyl transferases group 1 [Paenibacillaceae bacterium GAS479]|nr:Glycosyl transferases group 1 [Paenibacillaceae bacterium GAS479]